MIVALVLALAGAILAAYAIPHAMGVGRFPEHRTTLILAAVNCAFILFYTTMAQTIIEDGFLSFIILAITSSLGFQGHVWAIPLALLVGLILATITNFYVREIVGA